jgi:hypothetical protein
VVAVEVLVVTRVQVAPVTQLLLLAALLDKVAVEVAVLVL